MDNRRKITREFGRQARPMAVAPAFRSADVLDRIVDALGPPPPGRVLDLACGPGIVSEAVAPLSTIVVGVDVTPEMVSLAVSRLRQVGFRNCLFPIAAAERLPFPDSSFDAVVTRLSIHHFLDPAEVLAEVRRVLRPEGRLVSADIVSSGNADEALLHNALERLRDPTHVRMWTDAEVRSLVRAADFEIISEERWEQHRTYAEWAAIVADASRTEPLREVMRALARAGEHAGIRLTESDGEIVFTHTWLLVVAQAGA